MSIRIERVEELLRRELAWVLIHGNLRDPRLGSLAAISVTGVSVAADLGSAQVFVDVLAGDVDKRRVVAGLKACAPAIRRAIANRVHLKRTPSLIFKIDQSIAQGARIAQILAEVAPREDTTETEGETRDGPDESGETGE